MWNGKMKAVTFSFDDGVLQDERMISILDKYNLKATFMLNSALVGIKSDKLSVFGDFLYHQNRIEPSKIREIYKNHEIAGHTLMHQNLTEQEDSSIIYQVETDRRMLSELCGYDVVGFGYPCGGLNHNERVASIIEKNTKVKYARTNRCSRSLEFNNKNLFLFNPTVPVYDFNEIMCFAEEIINTINPKSPLLLYICGHSFELDEGSNINWENFETFCKFISNKSDIFYGTNKDILLKIKE